MYLLDTDICTLYLHGNAYVSRRYEQIGQPNIFISDITVVELIKGRLNSIKQCEANGGRVLVKAYSYLREQLQQLRDMNVVPYNMEADARFASYDAKTRRAGANDCRIATIAYVHGLTVVTANARHFDAIGCKHEDWTLAP